MTSKPSFRNKKPVGRFTLSALGLSVLLALSACSGDNTTAEDTAPVSEASDTAAVETAPVSEASDTAAVETEVPVADTEVIIPEPVIEAAPTETPVVAADVTEAVVAEPEVLATDAGATLYESNCKVCHENGLLNAPKYGDIAAWSARITKGKETLYMHSAKGFNKMPPQANDTVSEAQVHAAVDYMLASVS